MAPKLTPLRVHKVAQRLTNKSEIRILGYHLQVKNHLVDKALETNKSDITEAAFCVLKTWRKTMGRDEAYQILGGALVKCELNTIAEKVLNYKE